MKFKFTERKTLACTELQGKREDGVNVRRER